MEFIELMEMEETLTFQWIMEAILKLIMLICNPREELLDLEIVV
jgi:hypothetical protein